MNHAGVLSIVLLVHAAATADEKMIDPRSAVERYVAAALAGKVEDAVGLAVEGQSPGKPEKVEEFKMLVDARAVKLPTVWADDEKGRAIAVSEEVKLTKTQPDGENTGYLTFALVRTGGKWLVKDVDFRSADRAKDQVEQFKKRYANAKELPAKSGG